MKKTWVKPKSEKNFPCFPGQPKRKLKGPIKVDLMADGAWWARRLKRGVVVKCSAPTTKKKETKKQEIKDERTK